MAESGKDLLLDRLTALLNSFSEYAREVYRTRKDLTEITLVAKKKLARLEATEQERLALASISPPHKLEVLIHVDNVMGVKVPIVQLVEQLEEGKKPQSGSFHTKSKRIEETAEIFRQQIKTLIELAQKERVLDKLGREIKKTRHRFNALDRLLITELKSQIKVIELYLGGREREDQYKVQLFATEDDI